MPCWKELLRFLEVQGEPESGCRDASLAQAEADTSILAISRFFAS